MRKIILLFAFGMFAFAASAQKVAIKNNILYDAALTPNLGVEIGLGRATTLDLSGNYNPFELKDNKMWKHWLIQPEFRYWLCERFDGSFFGLHGLGGEFNASNVELPFGMVKELKNHRYEGWYWGAGVSYGYQWMLSRKWGIEATVGVGYIKWNYEKYECHECAPLLEKSSKNYFGPTKAAINLVFVFN